MTATFMRGSGRGQGGSLSRPAIIENKTGNNPPTVPLLRLILRAPSKSHRRRSFRPPDLTPDPSPIAPPPPGRGAPPPTPKPLPPKDPHPPAPLPRERGERQEEQVSPLSR